MSVVDLGVVPPRRTRRLTPALVWMPAVVGVAALLARPWFLPAGVQVEWRVLFFVALGVVGAAWPLSRRAPCTPAGLSVSLGVLAVGAAAFVVGRAVVAVPVGPSALATALALNALAAVAEEAFFRRYLYDLVAARSGPGVAVVATAALFALIHVTVWGWWVLPLDLAAGLVLSWQRAATGRWSVPAATHVLANTLAFPVRLPMLKPVRIAVVALLFAAGCATSGRDADAVTIGAIYPVSGRQGPGGLEEANGARLAVELANERGGVRGRPIRLELLDVDRGDAAPRALDQLRRRGAEVVLGTYGSTISAPAAVAAQRSGMVLWETGAVGLVGSDSGAGESFFRMAPMGAGLGRAAVAFVRDQLGASLGTTGPLRYAVAYVDDAYGRSVGLGAAEEAKASGQELVGTFPYSVRGLDAPALVRSIAASDPDVLFVSAYLDDGIALRKAQVSEGLALKASIGTSSSYCMPSFAAALGPAAVGLFASDKPDGREVRLDALQPEGREVLAWGRARYHERHGEDMTPAALSGFANAWALVGHVLPSSTGFSALEVAQAARSVKLATGTLPNGAGLDLAGPGVDDAGENRKAVSVIWQWVDARTQAVVWPPAFATRPLQSIPIQ